MKITYLALASLVATSQTYGALLITELVYDVCNPSALLDGSAPSGGEYFVLTNTLPAAIDLTGAEFDDDGDYSDGDGIIFPATTSLPGESSMIVAAGTQAEWESEYGTLPAGIFFFDSSSDWEALNNGGDSVGITGGDNNVSYADVTGDGEVAIWDGTAFVLGGIVTIHPDCGPQDYTPGTAGADAIAAVPETASALLSAFGAAFFLRRRR